jgi:hypothetical protein
MQQNKTHSARLLVGVVGAVFLVAGCKTKPPVKPDANAAPERAVSVGAILMPGGVEYSRAKLVTEVRKLKVYSVLRGIGNRDNEKLLFSPEMARALNLTAEQMQGRFKTTVSRGKRFEVYDASSSVTAEASDIIVDGLFTSATQEIQTIEGGVRVSVTRVRLQLEMKDRYTGQPLFPVPVEVVGQTGRSTGDRVVLAPAETTANPDVQKRLALDYERAMQRAFDLAAGKIEEILRPMGRVTEAEGNQVALTGGLTNGLQRDDQMVIFRASTRKAGETEIFGLMRPIVAVQCDSVGEKQSQCTVIRKADANAKAQPGDYAVLTDKSASDPR